MTDKQASDCSYKDQIATVWITVERILDWNALPYVNFVDFQKAFNSLHRERPWQSKWRPEYDRDAFSQHFCFY